MEVCTRQDYIHEETHSELPTTEEQKSQMDGYNLYTSMKLHTVMMLPRTLLQKKHRKQTNHLANNHERDLQLPTVYYTTYSVFI